MIIQNREQLIAYLDGAQPRSYRKRWIVAGSRTINSKTLVYKKLHECKDKYGTPSEVVSGGAKGVDTFARYWAFDNKIIFKEFKADWQAFGKAAGPIRNQEMANYAGSEALLVLIWDGISKGSSNMRKIAKETGMDIVEFIVK